MQASTDLTRVLNNHPDAKVALTQLQLERAAMVTAALKNDDVRLAVGPDGDVYAVEHSPVSGGAYHQAWGTGADVGVYHVTVDGRTAREVHPVETTLERLVEALIEAQYVDLREFEQLLAEEA